MTKTQEIELIQDIQQGSRQAEDELFTLFIEKITWKVQLMLGSNNEDWKDVAGDCMIAALFFFCSVMSRPIEMKYFGLPRGSLMTAALYSVGTLRPFLHNNSNSMVPVPFLKRFWAKEEARCKSSGL